jgi:hypothetical protein
MGQKVHNNAILLDGAPLKTAIHGAVRMRPSVEAIQEFRVEAGWYSAEYGTQSGAQIIATIRPGTNDFHGVLFEFLRNEKLDARNFFGTRRDLLKRNQFGAAVGGPVFIPRLYNGKNRTFFFTLWSHQFERQRNTMRPAVLTDCARNGVFRYWEVYQNGNINQITSGLGTANPINQSVDSFGNPVRPEQPHVLGKHSIVGADGTTFRSRDDLHRMKAKHRDIAIAAIADRFAAITRADSMRRVFDHTKPVSLRKLVNALEIARLARQMYNNNSFRQLLFPLSNDEFRGKRLLSRRELPGRNFAGRIFCLVVRALFNK